MQPTPRTAQVLSWLREDAPALDATPTAFFDLDRVVQGIELVRRAHPRVTVTYAVKASYLRPLLEAVRQAGAGASVFSDMEMFLAGTAGFAPADIVYNGVGRHGRALQEAIDAGAVVNLESLAEVRSLCQVRGAAACRAGVGIRVNGSSSPDGEDLGKYDVLGIDLGDLRAALDLLAASGLVLRGVSFHRFGNQPDAAHHLRSLDALLPAVQALAGHPSFAVEYVDVGGGFASRLEVPDDRAVASIRAIAERVHRALGVGTIVELGRFLVADAEFVVSRVVDVRTSRAGRVAILDVTTNYLIPAPGHRFRVESLAPVDDRRPTAPVHFVDRLGSTICQNETGLLEPGMLVCVLNAGAYAGVMKERFVYPLPDMRYIRGGAVIGVSPAGGNEAVLACHSWNEVRTVARTGER